MSINTRSLDVVRHKAVDFTPARALNSLLRAHRTRLRFLKPWWLIQLLAWAILDQEPGKRTKQGVHHAQRSRRRHARAAGNYLLAVLLAQPQLFNAKTIASMRKLFELRGGASAYLFSDGSRDMFLEACSAKRDLFYVYRVVDYLCRCQKFVHDEGRFDIVTAEQFLEELAPEGEGSYGKSKIEKIWLKYRAAAPYIYAFYPILSRGLNEEIKSLPAIVSVLETFAYDGSRLKRLIGQAAYAANVLRPRVKKIRFRELEKVEPVEPLLRPFSELEQALVQNIDRDAPIA